MLGLGTFSATDVTTFQMFSDQSVQGRCTQYQRSVSPWTQQSAECYSYQLPGEMCSRLVTDQFTPQEYPTATKYPIVTKLPSRQLHWETSHTHGYDMAAAALSYNVETDRSAGHHPGHVHQVAVTTSSTGWSLPFHQTVSQNMTTATAADCSAANHQLQTFQDPTKNYFADCSVDDVAMQSLCGQAQFTGTSSAVTAFSAGQPHVSDCTSYCATPANLYSGSGVKSDPEAPSDWQCALPPAWHQPAVCSTSSPGQRAVCSSTVSPLAYHNTVPYTPVATPTQVSPWSTSCEQKLTLPITLPNKITPSMSIGE